MGGLLDDLDWDGFGDEFEELALRESPRMANPDAEGREWEIVIIEAGLSANNRYYPPEVLRDAIPRFEGARVYAYQFSGDYLDHLPSELAGKDFPRNLVGWIEGVRYGNFKKPDGSEGEGLLGRLHVVDEHFRKVFRNAWAEGKRDLLGFSIDVKGRVSKSVMRGRVVDRVEEITEVNSVDVVSRPAAGGQLKRLVASQGGERPVDRAKVLELVKGIDPQLAEGVDPEKLTEQQVIDLLVKALEAKKKKDEEKDKAEEAKPKPEDVIKLIKDGKLKDALELLEKLVKGYGYGYGYPAPKGKKESEDVAESDELKKKLEELERKMQESERREANRRALRERLDAAKGLPQPAKTVIAAQFEARLAEAEDQFAKDLDATIKSWLDTVAAITGKSVDVGAAGDRAEVGLTEAEKLQAALDLTIGYRPDESERKRYEGIRPFEGIREAFVRFTGDAEIRSIGGRRLSEAADATTTDFPYALGVSMNRRLVKEYRAMPALWRQLVNVVPLKDFKQQELIRWGSFGTLSEVGEDPAAGYPHLTAPSEERATYSPSTRGALFTVTRKMIKNDDLRVIQRFLRDLPRAAHRTLSQFVFDLLINYGGSPSPSINGGTIYDGMALYHANHGNLLADPLSFDSLNAAIDAMMKQKPLDEDTEFLGIRPKFLVVPIELRVLAEIILSSDRRPGVADNDVNTLKGSMQPIVSPFLRGDASNWYCVADPAEIDTIEIGFVDGREEPELLVQDQPTVGEVFTHDNITYKIRHEYGGCVVDYRAFVGAIVA